MYDTRTYNMSEHQPKIQIKIYAIEDIFPQTNNDF